MENPNDGGDAPLTMQDYILVCRLTNDPLGVIQARTPEEACSHDEVASAIESDPRHWTRLRENDPEARYDLFTPRNGWIPSWQVVQDMSPQEISRRAAFAGSWGIRPEIAERERMEDAPELEDSGWRPDPTDPGISLRRPADDHAKADGAEDDPPRDGYRQDPTEERIPAAGLDSPVEEGPPSHPEDDGWSDPLGGHASAEPVHPDPGGEVPEEDEGEWKDIQEPIPPGPRHGHRKGRRAP